ncbi:transglycosylase SLT domain-containing protein [Paracoccus sp. S-4012]|uniref:lytic transglycosylase domain-containing protein n=1 Tax=Paracoccus sp. S-4012 TaxID=2665648 RepID=UPI0012AFA246|nr:lytic transglycosylase domain-containing protein [Paracoccus sp. S-4012]MRX51591.1 transglycosylase SLT domain-containing protein [Paracoccus sp. S-4012]
MRLTRLARLAALPLALLALAACESTTTTAAIAPAPQAAALSEAPPAMRWGNTRGGDAWRREVLAALDADGVNLIQRVPGDVASFCPGFASAEPHERKAFWAGLLSSLAKHESTWNPQARGGGGKWLGLMQIAPATWRGYGCTGEILDGGDNLSCAVRIMNKQVGRDGVIAGGGKHGVGRDWAPMRSASKRADIAGWTKAQSYCQG